MAYLPPSELKPRQSPGIALFMVIGAITVLALLVSEFTYIAQVHQKVAYDTADQLKAHYLAKSALKLSLLRLKAYVNVKNLLGAVSGNQKNPAPGAPSLPKAILEKIWSFPFFFPIPSQAPGLTMTERDAIVKFQKDSALEGRFSAIIESESSKFNLNLISSSFANFSTAPSPSPSPSNNPANPNPDGTTAPQPATPNAPGNAQAPQVDTKESQKALSEYLDKILRNRLENDPDFSSEYRDVRIDDLTDNLIAWADRNYERVGPAGRESVALKRMPFNSISELHMVNGLDDRLYELFAPNFSAGTIPMINVNTIQEGALGALVPSISKDEIKEFFKYRDGGEEQSEDHSFRTEDEFFDYLQKNISVFHNDKAEVDRFKQTLAKRGIRISVDEAYFKITVQATVQQSSKTLEAWVIFSPEKKNQSPNQPPPPVPVQPSAIPVQGAQAPPETGLRVLYMRIL